LLHYSQIRVRDDAPAMDVQYEPDYCPGGGVSPPSPPANTPPPNEVIPGVDMITLKSFAATLKVLKALSDSIYYLYLFVYYWVFSKF
jgi:hypothetical protein